MLKYRKNVIYEYIIGLFFLLILTDLTIFLNIYIIRQLLSFVFFTFIPGFLILQILKLNEISFLKKIILSVGISVSILMFLGLLINSLIIIKNPLSSLPILVSLNSLILTLLILLYFRYRIDFDPNKIFNIKIKFSGKHIYFILFPFLLLFASIFGVLMLNTTGSNTLLLSVLLLVPIYLSLIIFLEDKVHENIYLIVIIALALSIYLLRPLRFLFVPPNGDMSFEYYAFKLTLSNQYWNFASFPHNVNACVSITILPTIYYILSGMKLYSFTIYLSIISALTPVVIYLISRKFTTPMGSFLSSIIFMLQFPVISMIGAMRFRIALFFISIFILTILDNELREEHRKFLKLVFGVSIILSYYSAGILIAFLLLISMVVKIALVKASKREKEYSNLTLPFVMFFLITSFIWYGLLQNFTLTWFLNFIFNFIEGVLDLSPAFIKANIGYLGNLSEHPATKITLLITGITILLILLGVCFTVVELIRRKSSLDFITIMFSSGIISGIASFIFVFFKGYDPFRLIQQMLVIQSSGYFVSINKLFSSNKIKKTVATTLVILQFLASTYLIYQIFGVPYSEIVNSEGLRYSKFYVHQKEVNAAQWLSTHKLSQSVVLADYYGILTYSQVDPFSPKILSDNLLSNINSYYIFLRYENVVNGVLDLKYKGIMDTDRYEIYYTNSNKIYTNGGSEIYFSGGVVD